MKPTELVVQTRLKLLVNDLTVAQKRMNFLVEKQNDLDAMMQRIEAQIEHLEKSNPDDRDDN